MKAGDRVRCVADYGYLLTFGEEYMVMEYEPAHPDTNFTWPAYVQVEDDDGHRVWCHASRFEVVS